MTEKEFIEKSAGEIRQKLKKFPQDFLEENAETEIFKCNGEVLILGAEFFGMYDLINPRGELKLQLPDFESAKYYVYSSLSKPKEFPVPVNKNVLLQSVKKYELYLDEILKEIKDNFNKSFPDSPNANRAVIKVFQSLNLQRY